MITKEDNYKGNPIITITESDDDKYPFSFGVSKAKKILESINEIKAFYEKHKKEQK